MSGGEAFLDDARARGAAATLVPDDAHASLAALGSAVRARSDARVVAIAGSVGKTSTKDILAALLRTRLRTVAAPDGFNNEVGLPLTLCRIEAETEVVVTEMAMRGPGQIRDLARVARPDLGVITSIAPVHLEQLGSLENIARAKAELLHALPAGSVAVLPEDTPVLEPFVPQGLDVRRFGEPDAEVRDGRTHVRWRDREVVFDFTACHQATNAAAALTAAEALGVELPQEPVEVEFSRWRSQETELPGGGLLINDSWNANPVAMRAALAHLLARANGRRTIAILGEMAELGPQAPRYHEEVGTRAKPLISCSASESSPGTTGPTNGHRRPPRRASLRSLVRPGDAILVKGSRSVGLEVSPTRCWRRRRDRVLIAAAVGLALSVGFGPRFIDFLRRNEFGQHIREEGPQHFHKQGIPTMGGLLILFAATVAFLPVSHYRLQALTVLFTALACGAIGFLDDFIKLTHKRSLGLSGRWKLLLLAGVTVVVAIVARHLHLSTDVYIPVIDVTVPLSYGWYVFLFFVIAGAANGTNLADGVDGLLAGQGSSPSSPSWR